jgi:flagellar protein FlbD
MARTLRTAKVTMLKLTRLDHHLIAINPDHVAWVEATPDTTLCLIGDRKIIVRESLDEVVERFIAARAAVGCSTSSVIAKGHSSENRRGSSSLVGGHQASRSDGGGK